MWLGARCIHTSHRGNWVYLEARRVLVFCNQPLYNWCLTHHCCQGPTSKKTLFCLVPLDGYIHWTGVVWDNTIVRVPHWRKSSSLLFLPPCNHTSSHGCSWISSLGNLVATWPLDFSDSRLPAILSFIIVYWTAFARSTVTVWVVIGVPVISIPNITVYIK